MIISIFLACVYAQNDTRPNPRPVGNNAVALILDYSHANARENPIYNIETDPLRKNLVSNKDPTHRGYSVWYYKIKTSCPGIQKRSFIAVECGWPSSCNGWNGKHYSYMSTNKDGEIKNCLGKWDLIAMNYDERCNNSDYQCFIFV